MKDIKRSLNDAPQGSFNYRLRGDRNTWEMHQPEQVSQRLQMTGGEEELPVYSRTSLAPSRPPQPPRERATPYGPRPPTQVPTTYGPDRTPSHRPDPARMEETWAPCTISNVRDSPHPPEDEDVDPAFFYGTSHEDTSWQQYHVDDAWASGRIAHG